MRKNKWMYAVTLLCGMAFVGQVSALQPGQTQPPGPVQPVFGTFEAKVKHWYKRQLPGGYTTYFTVYTITDISMEYCNQQLQTWLANGNTTVVQYCTQVN